VKKWGKSSEGPKKVRSTSAPAEAPTDPFSDEQIRHFSRKRLIELASSGGDTAARQAASELLERAEPKAAPKTEQLSRADALRICDIYDRHFREDGTEKSANG